MAKAGKEDATNTRKAQTAAAAPATTYVPGIGNLVLPPMPVTAAPTSSMPVAKPVPVAPALAMPQTAPQPVPVAPALAMPQTAPQPVAPTPQPVAAAPVPAPKPVSQGATQGISKVNIDINDPTMWSFAPQTYSQATRDYLAQLDALAASKAPGIGNYYNALIPNGSMSNGDVDIPIYATEAALRPYVGQPLEQNLGYTADVGGKWGTTGAISAGPGTSVVLVDDKTGKTVYAGTGFDAAEKATQTAKDLGSKHAWSIYEAPEGTTDYYRWSQNEPQMSVLAGLGKLVSTVGPLVAGAALGPTASALSKAGAAAGAAGAGSALQGKSIADILKDATLAGVGSYAGSKLFPSGASSGASGASGSAAGSTASSAGGIGGSLAGLDPESIVNIVGHLPSTVGSTLGSIAGGIGSNVLSGGAGSDTLDDNTITVSGKAPPPVSPVGSAVGAAIGGIGGGFDPNAPENVTISAKPPQPTVPVPPPLIISDPGPVSGSTPDTSQLHQNTPDVSPKPPKIPITKIPQVVTGVTGVVGGIGDLLGGGGGDDSGGSTSGGGGTVDIPGAISDYKRIAVVPTFDPFTYGQAGGDQPGEFAFYQGYKKGGKVKLTPQEQNIVDYSRRNMATDIAQMNPDGTVTTFKGAISQFPNGQETLFPTFWNGHVLPVDEARQRAIESGIDWPQYGTDWRRAEEREQAIHSQFMEPDADAYARRDPEFMASLHGFAGGGGIGDHAAHAAAFAAGQGHVGPGPVAGIGTGQDDRIPAWLSDGEYVWSAQDVADLGDGSTKAGVERLDAMRQEVRRRAGRKDVKHIAKPQKGIGHLLASVGA